jgi:hypothetical protein
MGKPLANFSTRERMSASLGLPAQHSTVSQKLNIYINPTDHGQGV